MTYEQIEKEFYETSFKWVDLEDGNGRYILESQAKSFLKQSFIKYLKGEVERLKKSKKIGDDFQCYHTDPFGNKTPTVIEKRLSGEDKAYNQAISDQITHITNQIEELEV